MAELWSSPSSLRVDLALDWSDADESRDVLQGSLSALASKILRYCEMNEGAGSFVL